MTLSGSLEEINAKLAGVGRNYEPLYDYDGALPTDTDVDGVPDGGVEVIASVSRTDDYAGIYQVSDGQGGSTYYHQTDYHSDYDQSTSTHTNTASYAEVAYDAGQQAWNYIAGGAQLIDIDPGAQGAPVWYQSGDLNFDVKVSHDGSGQYWTYEANTATYKALRVEGLAVYEKDGERFEHDTVLDTLSLLQPHIADVNMPGGYISWPAGWQAPSDATGLGTALATVPGPYGIPVSYTHLTLPTILLV